MPCCDGGLRDVVSWQGTHPVWMCKPNVNCKKKGISVEEKISEFKLFRHNESFYFMNETVTKSPIKE